MAADARTNLAKQLLTATSMQAMQPPPVRRWQTRAQRLAGVLAVERRVARPVRRRPCARPRRRLGGGGVLRGSRDDVAGDPAGARIP